MGVCDSAPGGNAVRRHRRRGLTCKPVIERMRNQEQEALHSPWHNQTEHRQLASHRTAANSC